ncbi:MAG: thioredoxin domain-containing protein [Candidatus Diapherotrites archaeon]|nr:thioredoxin domain-containing protein [Candidatus Diapherotrites archaeon]
MSKKKSNKHKRNANAKKTALSPRKEEDRHAEESQPQSEAKKIGEEQVAEKGPENESRPKQPKPFDSSKIMLFSVAAIILVFAAVSIGNGALEGLIGTPQGGTVNMVIPPEDQNTSVGAGSGGGGAGGAGSGGGSGTEPANGSGEIYEDALTQVDLFAMSYCPHGTRAEKSLIPVLEEFGKEVEFNIYFIAEETGNGSFSSLHGQPEVEEDTRQLCVLKNSHGKLFDYLLAVADNLSHGKKDWGASAETAGLTAEEITELEACALGEEGKTLLSENIKRAKQLGISGSPTFYIDGEPYSGRRDPISLKRAICKFASESEVCKNLPPEQEINLLILNDKTCALCDPAQMIGSIKGLFSNLAIKEIDMDSVEGQELIKEAEISGLPAYFFYPDNVEKHEQFGVIEQYLTETENSLYLLNTAPIKTIGREEIKNTVDLFVMSQCPYGTMAEATLKEMVKSMPDLEYNIRFIAESNGDGNFSSLHGQNEVDENLRQVCIMENYPDKLLDYLECANADYRNIGDMFAECAGNAGIDATSVEECAKGVEGTKLLEESIAFTDELGITASPTWLVNNSIFLRGYSIDTVQRGVCLQNPDLSGCDIDLEMPSSANVDVGGSC